MKIIFKQIEGDEEEYPEEEEDLTFLQILEMIENSELGIFQFPQILPFRENFESHK